MAYSQSVDLEDEEPVKPLPAPILDSLEESLSAPVIAAVPTDLPPPADISQDADLLSQDEAITAAPAELPPSTDTSVASSTEVGDIPAPLPTEEDKPSSDQVGDITLPPLPESLPTPLSPEDLASLPIPTDIDLSTLEPLTDLPPLPDVLPPLPDDLPPPPLPVEEDPQEKAVLLLQKMERGRQARKKYIAIKEENRWRLEMDKVQTTKLKTASKARPTKGRRPPTRGVKVESREETKQERIEVAIDLCITDDSVPLEPEIKKKPMPMGMGMGMGAINLSGVKLKTGPAPLVKANTSPNVNRLTMPAFKLKAVAREADSPAAPEEEEEPKAKFPALRPMSMHPSAMPKQQPQPTVPQGFPGPGMLKPASSAKTAPPPVVPVTVQPPPPLTAPLPAPLTQSSSSPSVGGGFVSARPLSTHLPRPMNSKRASVNISTALPTKTFSGDKDLPPPPPPLLMSEEPLPPPPPSFKQQQSYHLAESGKSNSSPQLTARSPPTLSVPPMLSTPPASPSLHSQSPTHSPSAGSPSRQSHPPLDFPAPVNPQIHAEEKKKKWTLLNKWVKKRPSRSELEKKSILFAEYTFVETKKDKEKREKLERKAKEKAEKEQRKKEEKEKKAREKEDKKKFGK